MRACAHCGKPNQDQYRFCLSCGADLAGTRTQSAAEIAEAENPATPNTLTVRMHVKCRHCASPVPVNAPVERVRCGACLRETGLPGLASTLKDASHRVRTLGSPYDVAIVARPEAECAGCGELVDVGAHARDPAPGLLPCTRCKVGVPSWPAPAWLRAALPNAGFVLGGDPQAAPPDAGVAIEIPQTAPQPIAMACPQCGGGLMITAEDERTTTCRFCSVAVFLPDELWRRLHPVATMRTWTLTYIGRALLEPAEHAAAEEARRDAAARAYTAAPAPAPPSEATDEPVAPPRRSLATVLAVAAIAVATLVGILVLVS